MKNKTYSLVLLAITVIILSIYYYDYTYEKYNYVYSRGIYMPYPAICDNGVLYNGRRGAVFNIDGTNVLCKNILMTQAEKDKSE